MEKWHFSIPLKASRKVRRDVLQEWDETPAEIFRAGLPSNQLAGEHGKSWWDTGIPVGLEGWREGWEGLEVFCSG